MKFAQTRNKVVLVVKLSRSEIRTSSQSSFASPPFEERAVRREPGVMFGGCLSRVTQVRLRRFVVTCMSLGATGEVGSPKMGKF